MAFYYTADTHFHHKNIVIIEERDFDDVSEMNEYLITKWNSQVKEDDTVVHVGDFALGSFNKIVSVLERLNGNIILVGGNHDEDKVFTRIMRERPELIKEFIPVGFKEKWGEDWIWFSHYPMEIGVRANKWNIHGHIHSEDSNYPNQINVGIDSPQFKHLPFGQLLTKENIMEVMKTKESNMGPYTHD